MTRIVPALNRAQKDARIYRQAARRSLEEGDGLGVIELHRRLENRWWEYCSACPDGSTPVDREEFCMALLMMAAVAETGDL